MTKDLAVTSRASTVGCTIIGGQRRTETRGWFRRQRRMGWVGRAHIVEGHCIAIKPRLPGCLLTGDKVHWRWQRRRRRLSPSFRRARTYPLSWRRGGRRPSLVCVDHGFTDSLICFLPTLVSRRTQWDACCAALLQWISAGEGRVDLHPQGSADCHEARTSHS